MWGLLAASTLPVLGLIRSCTRLAPAQPQPRRAARLWILPVLQHQLQGLVGSPAPPPCSMGIPWYLVPIPQSLRLLPLPAFPGSAHSSNSSSSSYLLLLSLWQRCCLDHQGSSHHGRLSAQGASKAPPLSPGLA